MLLVREIFHCKPGKVRPMVEKFLAMSKLNEKAGFGKSMVIPPRLRMNKMVAPTYATVDRVAAITCGTSAACAA